MKIKFTIWGEPLGKQRQRHRYRNFQKPYTPEETVKYENLVKLEYENQCGGMRFDKDTPLDMRITAYLSIPDSVSKKKRQAMIEGKIRPIKKPDFDNISKIVADGLQKIAYPDDKQIVDSQTRKFYGEQPRVVVTIQEAK